VLEAGKLLFPALAPGALQCRDPSALLRRHGAWPHRGSPSLWPHSQLLRGGKQDTKAKTREG